MKENQKKQKTNKGVSAQRGKILNRSYIFLALAALVSFWLYNNWSNINDYLASLDIDNPVNKEVIEDYDSADSPHRSSGVEKMLLVLSEPDQEETKINSVFVFTSSDEKGFYLSQYIPGEVYVSLCSCDIANEVSISSLPYIGATFEEELKYEFSIWQLEKLLATEFDSYVWFGQKATKVLIDEFGLNLSDPISTKIDSINSVGSVFNLISRLNEISQVSDDVLSNVELPHIYKQLRKFDLDDPSQVSINYSNSEFLEPAIHQNGDEIFILGTQGIDESLEEVKDRLVSKDIEREQTKIEVYNGSAIPGLASRYSRILQNNGMSVVRIGNSEQGYTETTIFIPNREQYKNTLAYVEVLIGEDEYNIIEERPVFLSTGDIVIILGQDLSESSLPYVIY